MRPKLMFIENNLSGGCSIRLSIKFLIDFYVDFYVVTVKYSFPIYK